jgi:hypothetical protein
VRRIFAAVAMILIAAAACGSSAKSGQDWDGFWRARGVDPAPPRDFIEIAQPHPEILNLTNGAISDTVARQWAMADLKRGHGDRWATCHLRLDIVNSGVLGTPGLSGSDEGIEQERARGAVALACEPRFVVERIAVVAVSKKIQISDPQAGLTNFVIVMMSRANGRIGVRTMSNGRKEDLQTRHTAGDLIWQLDTGNFRDDPVVGPLWYQAKGWSCRVDGFGTINKICSLVRPK